MVSIGGSSSGRNPDGRVWSHSEVLNLDIWWLEDDLRFWDPVAGGWLLRREEERERAEDAETRADEERDGRLEESSRAEAAESRVLELEAELRRLRGE